MTTKHFKYNLCHYFLRKKGDNIKGTTYVVVDIETTGLSPNYHKITEIAAVKIRNHKVIDDFSTLVNPQCKIPRFITKLTGIDDELVKDAPKASKAMPLFTNFLDDDPFVAHNAWFDYSFLNANSMKYDDKSLTNDVICTCKLARRLLPELPSKKLGVVCDHFNIHNEKAHRAMGDARATAMVFSKFMKMLDERGIKKHEELLGVVNNRIKLGALP